MKYVLILSIVLIAAGCKVEPVALQYGKDHCYTCKMTLTDNKFGAEVVTDKGKIYVFDDTNCMVNFLNSGYLEESEVKFKLIADYTQPGKLVPVEQGFFLKSDEIRSPMNSAIAAFENEASMREFKKQWNAIYLGWGELQTEFK
jgi:copper chaperone NosL